MKTLLIALLLLVVGTGTAFAECAWALWSGVPSAPLIEPGGRIMSEGLMWIPLEAYERREECMKVLNERKSQGATTLLTCLPDTVDPRRPKGR